MDHSPSDPARAFADLRAEVSLLRRAVEGLTAERQNAHDYEPTLTAMAEQLTVIARSSAMQLPPADVVQQIKSASKKARAEDCAALERYHRDLATSIGRINAVVDQAWTADRQFKNLFWTASGGIVVGISLWAIFIHVI